MKPFQFYIQTIGRGQKRRRSLTLDEARDAMRMIMAGKVSAMQLGAFLMIIRVREETPEEAAGFLEAIRETINLPILSISSIINNPLKVDLDWGSYAGKRRQLPWFMLALTLLQRQGITIFLHGIVGNDEMRLYSKEVSQLLNWPQANSLIDARNKIISNGYCYLEVADFAPQIKTLMNYRDELGLRSPIHTLARMLNPFNAQVSVHGVFHKGYDDIHQKTASFLKDKITVAFCGDSGEAEVRPDRKTEIKILENFINSKEEWQQNSWSYTLPKTFFNHDPTAKCLDTTVLMNVWQGKSQHDYGAATVIQTLAMVFITLHNSTQKEAYLQAKTLWDNRNLHE